MSDISPTIDPPRRRPHQRRHIPLPNGDELMPREEFAEDTLGVSDKTASRMNLPTTYFGNVAYVAKNASLAIVAERVRCRNEPPKRRRGK